MHKLVCLMTFGLASTNKIIKSTVNYSLVFLHKTVSKHKINIGTVTSHALDVNVEPDYQPMNLLLCHRVFTGLTIQCRT